MVKICTLTLTFLPAILAQVYNFDPAFSFEVLQHQSANSPYHISEWPEAINPAPPTGCNVTRATYAIRHASIHANSFDYESYIEPFLQKLGNASVDWSKTSTLSFLSDWKSGITTENGSELTESGQQQAMQLGRNVSSKYPSFKQPERLWASEPHRTQDSARNFLKGYSKNPNATQLIVVPEGEEDGANTLAPHDSCSAYSGSIGSDQQDAFFDVYLPPLVTRFNAQLMQADAKYNNGTSLNFTMDDVYAMQLLCGYDASLRGSSPFCSPNLFSADEWQSFEYSNDLRYHINIGYGSDIAGAQGVPYLNASVELLLADNATQDLYVSFVHRELPPALYVALGLFNNSLYSGTNNPNATMPETAVNPGRLWRSSNILSYLVNVAIEKMSCSTSGYASGEYYRVLVSNTPQRLPGCADGPGTSCSRTTFVDWFKERQMMFKPFDVSCRVDYDNSTDSLDIYNNRTSAARQLFAIGE